jgi:hypothetical protein
MKKSLYIKVFINITPFLLVLLFLSCKEDDLTFKGPYHVRFTDSLLTVKESINKPIRISIHNAGPILNEEIKIKYTISGTARKGVDYTITSKEGEVEIDDGESIGYIDLNVINNANNILESQEIIFTITEVTPSNLQIGRSKDGIIGKSLTVIIEDECILSGTYKSFPADSISDLPVIQDIEVSSTDCIEYTLSNWDIYITSYFPYSKDLKFIDNGDNTLTIPEQEEDALPAERATMKGDGFVDPTTRKITLNIQFVDFTDQPTFKIELYPQ